MSEGQLDYFNLQMEQTKRNIALFLSIRLMSWPKIPVPIRRWGNY